MDTLLHPDRFSDVFGPLTGKRVGVVKMYGNVGDRMIDWATEQLLEYYGVEHGTLNWAEGGSDVDQALWSVDTVLYAGGGNLGTLYRNCSDLRARYHDSGKELVVLPQSLTNLEEPLDAYSRIYLREQHSLDLYPEGILAPDLALGFSPPQIDVDVVAETGIFIREDDENFIGSIEFSLGDPIELRNSVTGYLELAARFQTIYTDRLHFAICGLILGRNVYLLPGSYHKNRSMHQTWLKDLGCRWCESASEIPECEISHLDDLYQELAGLPSALLSWTDIPSFSDSLKRNESGSEICLSMGESNTVLTLDSEAAPILDSVNGKQNIDEISRQQSRLSDSPLLDVARNVQEVLCALASHGLVTIKNDSGKSTVSSYRFQSGVPCFSLHIEPPVRTGKVQRYQANLRFGDEQPKVIWFESYCIQDNYFSPLGDSFVLASLLPAMRMGAPLCVTGKPVSRGLLDNLYEFQMIFISWFPNLQFVAIHADVAESSSSGEHGIAAYTGGIDSTFSLYRQNQSPPLHWYFSVSAALFVRGFDVFVSSRETFKKALDRAACALGRQNIDLITVNTNIRELYSEWKQSHGLFIAAALSLFNHRFSSGLIAATIPYKMLYPFGSNAITDRLMGSQHFRIVHDGAEFDRIEKIGFLAQYPEAVQHLRFCYQDFEVDQNCGKCEKCITTAILLIAKGLPLTCFSHPPDQADIEAQLNHLTARLYLNNLVYHDLKSAQMEMEANKRYPPWYETLDNLLRNVSSVA